MCILRSYKLVFYPLILQVRTGHNSLYRFRSRKSTTVMAQVLGISSQVDSVETRVDITPTLTSPSPSPSSTSTRTVLERTRDVLDGGLSVTRVQDVSTGGEMDNESGEGAEKQKAPPPKLSKRALKRVSDQYPIEQTSKNERTKYPCR